MESLKSVLLVFDDSKELEFIEEQLVENDFQVYKCNTLNDALVLAERKIPNLIVINTNDSEINIQSFIGKVKTDRLKDSILLSLIELEDFLKVSSKEHFVVKPVRPKLLLSLIRSMMNREKINWLPSFH
ncbi:MAG: response regulator transcription factor [Bacteroidetes bacterium]|nr:response regulator transcription factor [Bacteroidota bacterium]